MAERDAIESCLGDVPLPEGLQQRLSLESLFDDDAIDRLLRGVPVPAGLQDRMLTARSREVRRSRSVDLDRQPVVGEPDRRPVAPATPVGAAGRRARGRVWWGMACAGLVAAILVAFNVAGPARRGGSRRPFDVTATTVDPDPVMVQGGAIDWQQPDPGQPLVANGDDGNVVAPPPPAPVGHPAEPELALDDGRGAADEPEPADGAAPVRDIVGFPVAIDDRRDSDPMEVVPLVPGVARRLVPRSPAYDLAFELRYGEPPFVYPQIGLAVDAPPLTSRTTTFDALRWSPASRIRRPEAARLRVEDVLAAMPEPFASRADDDVGPRLTLRGVRWLRPRPAALVEVAVTAPRLARSGSPLEAAVVLGKAMSPAAWDATCRGLRMVADEMRTADRLTIVVAGGQSRVAGRRLDAAAVAAAGDELRRERLEAGPAGVVAAVQFARQLLASGGGAGPVVLVAGADPVPGSDAGLGETRVVRVAPHGVPPPTAAAPGLVAPTGGDVGRAIVERVFGTSALAANGCRLSVSFDPRAVHAYRLVGHRQTAVESLAAGREEPIDMLAGQTVRAVYEVVWRPEPTPSGPVISATFAWQPVGGSGRRNLAAELARSAIETADGGDAAPPGQRTWLPSPRGCELLLAVGFGELASQSVHLGARVGGPAVADVAQGWRRRGDVTPFGEELIDGLERLGVVRPARPGADPGR